MTDETDSGRKVTIGISMQEVLDDTGAYANQKLNTIPQG